MQVVKEAKRAAKQLENKQAKLAKRRPEGHICSKESRELQDQMTKYAAENILAAENLLAAEVATAAAAVAQKAADIAADAADAENLLAAKEKAAAAVAADPKKAKRKQQEQAIRSRRCYKKSKRGKNSTEHSR